MYGHYEVGSDDQEERRVQKCRSDLGLFERAKLAGRGKKSVLRSLVHCLVKGKVADRNSTVATLSDRCAKCTSLRFIETSQRECINVFISVFNLKWI